MKKDVTNQEKTTVYQHKALERIENERALFYKSYKFHNTLKFIVTVICLIAILIAFILMPNIDSLPKGAQSGITVGIAVVALGLTYGYSVYVRKKFDKKMKEYFNLYFSSINEYAFSSKEFSKVELQNPGKITLDEFNACKLYKDVFEAGSRGLTKFIYKKINMDIVDCAGNIKDAKKIKPVFVGKMVRAKASYKGKTPIFIYIKGNERALPPTNIEDVKNVFEDKKMIVRSNYKDWKKVLNGSVMKALNLIKTEKILVDVAISLYEEKVFIMMGYDDPLMVLPLQTEFNPKPTEKYKKDISAISTLVEVLNK